MAEATPDLETARRLIEQQCPQWSALELETVNSAGTDNALFRLGDDLVVRLPKVERAASHAAREARWLPMLEKTLPLQIPTPVHLGEPSREFALSWSVVPWIEGSDLRSAALTSEAQCASDLAECLLVLRELSIDGAPAAGDPNNGRGAPLAARDRWMRRAVQALDEQDLVDAHRVLRLWQVALDAEAYGGKPKWLHGDPNAGNLIARDGKLCALIDWGLMAVGDPAVDQLAAWYLFDQPARETFRNAMAVDEAEWLRGAGWALSMAVIAWPYYLETNPTIVAESEQVVSRLLGLF